MVFSRNSPLFKRSLVTMRVEYMREYYLGDQRRADIRQWVEWQLCPGDKWTRVRHLAGNMSMWWGDMGADGTHLASSLPPGTDPLSKNEKISPIPCPGIILTYFHNNTHGADWLFWLQYRDGMESLASPQLDKNNLILKHQFVMLNKINIMFYELEIDFWWWSIFLV